MKPGKRNRRLEQKHITHGFIGLTCVVLGYLVGLRAIDSGSLWHYLFAIILFVVGVQQILKAIYRYFFEDE